MPSPLAPPSDLMAAIDMGSNSIRLELATLQGGRYRRRLYVKETVRLGAGLDSQGLLTEEAMQRGLDCLTRFAQTLREHEPLQVRAVATQTLREARNRNAFLQRARAALGHPIEVISGREEARLIYAGVAHLQPSRRRRLVVDIGGRSTEMILGAGPQPSVAESFAVGSVSLSTRFFADGRYTEEGFRQAQIAAGAELEEALAPFAPAHWDEALGASGTAGAVSDVLMDCGVTDGRITPQALRWLIEQCLRAGHADKLELPGLKPDRRPVLGGGLAILYTLATHFRIDNLLPAKGALRQGVLVDLHERQLARQRASHRGLRDESVAVLQNRFGVDRAQAARVRDLALALRAQVTPKASVDALDELRWATDLHEIGMMVSHHDHHRHSAYLLSHVDAAGFSQSQLRQVAQLVLGQRGGLRKLDDALTDAGFVPSLLALRLAIICCHARENWPGEAPHLTRRGRQYTLRLPRGWAAAHPRTRFLLEEEAAQWTRGGAWQLRLA